MPRHSRENHGLSRRTLLKGLGFAPVLLRPSPLYGYSLLLGPSDVPGHQDPAFPFADIRLTPHYPAKSPLEDVLRLVAPGSDEYRTEKYAFEIEAVLKQWSNALKAPAPDFAALAKSLDLMIEATRLTTAKETTLRAGDGIDIVRRSFVSGLVSGR